MSKLEKTAAANCKTLAHDAKQAFTADIIGRLAKDMPPAEAANTSESANVRLFDNVAIVQSDSQQKA